MHQLYPSVPFWLKYRQNFGLLFPYSLFLSYLSNFCIFCSPSASSSPSRTRHLSLSLSVQLGPSWGEEVTKGGSGFTHTQHTSNINVRKRRGRCFHVYVHYVVVLLLPLVVDREEPPPFAAMQKRRKKLLSHGGAFAPRVLIRHCFPRRNFSPLTLRSLARRLCRRSLTRPRRQSPRRPPGTPGPGWNGKSLKQRQKKGEKEV